MKYFQILFCFFIVNSWSFQTSKIAWRANYKLTWEDFRGTDNKASDAAATTASGITFGYQIQKKASEITSFKAEVDAYFYPKKSWVKSELATTYILAHEQLHFDITELHVRKMRKRISNLKPSNSIPEELEILHQEILKELKTMQKAYDKATDFSRNTVEQAKWQQAISTQLAALLEFEK